MEDKNLYTPSEILCRTCAAYSSCKLDKKGTATKCRNFWKHLSTSELTKYIK